MQLCCLALMQHASYAVAGGNKHTTSSAAADAFAASPAKHCRLQEVSSNQDAYRMRATAASAKHVGHSTLCIASVPATATQSDCLDDQTMSASSQVVEVVHVPCCTCRAAPMCLRIGWAGNPSSKPARRTAQLWGWQTQKRGRQQSATTLPACCAHTTASQKVRQQVCCNVAIGIDCLVSCVLAALALQV